MTIKLQRPHENQQRVLNECARFNIVCCGRRWGKSTLGLYLATRAALNGAPVGWFSPTYRMLSEIWREANTRLQPAITTRNASEYRLELLGGGTIDFWSLDRPDVARGRKYQRVLIDEAAVVPELENAWKAVLRPTLVDLKGDGWFLSTPQGYNYFHDLYSFGQDAELHNWASWHMPSTANPYLDPAEIDEARSTTDAVVFAQEYEADFTQRAGMVLFAFTRAGNVQPVEDNGSEIRVGMDFNVDPMSAVVWSKAADEMHVWNTIALRNSGTEEMCAEIKRRYPGRQIVVYPDPSGVARKTAAPVGQTDFTILKRHGFQVRAPNAAPPVQDRINETNALLCNTTGRRRLLVHPRCKALITSIERLAYKPDSSVVDKSEGYDHFTDAMMYAVHVEWPIGHKGGTAKVTGI